METILNVTGMKCGGCSSNVEKALSDIAGVESVSVDLEQKTVRILGEADITEATKRIRDLGFEISS